MNNLNFIKRSSETLETGSMYGQFLITNLLKGQAMTVANALRRVLLNDLSSVCITGIRIAGINHEFATIEGVREDITELLLNFKGVVIKGKINEPQFGKLKIQDPMVVTANLIELPVGLEIANPNHYITTTSTSTLLEIEIKFEYNKGFCLATSPILDYKDNNFLEIDRNFTPIQKAVFKLNSCEGNEFIIFSIWTNGSLSPDDAIYESCKLLVDSFTSIMKNQFIDKIGLKDQIQTFESIPSLEKTESDQLLIKSFKSSDSNSHFPKEIEINKQIDSNDIELLKHKFKNASIEELELPVRAYNCLKRTQIHTIADLFKYSPEELLKLKNFGRVSAFKLYTALKDRFGIIWFGLI
jgi:DNA-directed RNA polymerase subunit alpha